MALIGDMGTRIRLPDRVRKRFESVQRLGSALTGRLPKGLYARSILIVVLPILILQAVVANVFMDRHSQVVTRRLSSAQARDIAPQLEVIES